MALLWRCRVGVRTYPTPGRYVHIWYDPWFHGRETAARRTTRGRAAGGPTVDYPLGDTARARARLPVDACLAAAPRAVACGTSPARWSRSPTVPSRSSGALPTSTSAEPPVRSDPYSFSLVAPNCDAKALRGDRI